VLRVCTSSVIVKLSIGGVSLILTDVRFGSFSQNVTGSWKTYLLGTSKPLRKLD